MDMNYGQKIQAIKEWVGTGSINIFGLPMSGKDTVGVRLAEAIGGKFLSSGLIIRATEAMQNQHLTDRGDMIDTNIFYDWVLPYLDKPELKAFPLVMSSIGRVAGEEDIVMERAEKAGHPIKAAVILNVSEVDVIERWKNVSAIKDRGTRYDDEKPEVFQHRLDEFRKKTAPVLLHYRMMGMLVEVNGDTAKDAVFADLIDKLYAYIMAHPGS